MTQPAPITTTDLDRRGEWEALVEAAQELPGVADTVALMEAVSGLIAPMPTQLVVTRFATGGNLPDADLG